MKIMDIGQVAESTGIAPSTLRYYEELGLITSIGRHGLRRQYPADVVLVLALISLGKMAGFSLGEIGAMFGQDGQPDLPRDRLRDRAKGLRRQARQLTALAKAIDHVAECPAPSHMECPKFRRLVEVAAKNRGRAVHRVT